MLQVKFRGNFIHSKVKREQLGILKRLFRYLQSTDPKEADMAKRLPNIPDFQGMS